MGLLNAFNQWREDRYQKRIAKAQASGKCPDCSGLGYDPMLISEYYGYFSADELNCPGCNGTGSFTDWSSE
ncbi:methionine aminopeptidase [Desertibacillus haloalkaliphilus]|uniref:methionine aminopeptidase n=1 Tax=Desertibacillus haloalkaliphilus TaxID=1328930 RepID=UPI001C277794|nr:methionine aminopeptidase [Desertibacillus haloalkaliphilus]MBU8906501.1 methionine aminopeptidase [Desertibacillus haloalkaliphilus]